MLDSILSKKTIKESQKTNEHLNNFYEQTYLGKRENEIKKHNKIEIDPKDDLVLDSFTKIYINNFESRINKDLETKMNPFYMNVNNDSLKEKQINLIKILNKRTFNNKNK